MDIHIMTRRTCARGIRKSTPGILICMSFSCKCDLDKEFPVEGWVFSSDWESLRRWPPQGLVH